MNAIQATKLGLHIGSFKSLSFALSLSKGEVAQFRRRLRRCEPASSSLFSLRAPTASEGAGDLSACVHVVVENEDSPG